MARASEREERSSKKRGFVYRRTADDVKARANMKGGGFDSIFKSKYKVYKVRDGKNLIRIMPATWEDASHYGYDLWVNYGIGADNQSYLSLKAMKQEKDPLDEARNEAVRDNDKKLAAALKPRQRILMWVIDRNDEDEGPQLFPCPFSLDKAINNLSMDPDTKEVLYVDNEKDGCDIRFFKEGSGLNTDYPGEKIRIMKPSPLCDDEGLAEEWMEFIQENPLPECVQFYDYDHIAEVFDGTARVERDDEDDKPTRRARGNGRTSEDDDETPSKRAVRRSDDDEKPRSVRSRISDDQDGDDDGKGRARGRKAAYEDRKSADEDGDGGDTRKLRSSRFQADAEGDDDGEEDRPVRAKRRNNTADEERPSRARAQLDAGEDDDARDERSDRRRPSIRDRLSKSRSTDDEDDD